eukprot:210949-Chlamydomonas_euryale.AAC.1
MFLQSAVNFAVSSELGGRPHHVVPLRDDPDESLLPHLPAALAFIQAAAESGGRVLVHCQAGRSRQGGPGGQGSGIQKCGKGWGVAESSGGVHFQATRSRWAKATGSKSVGRGRGAAPGGRPVRGLTHCLQMRHAQQVQAGGAACIKVPPAPENTLKEELAKAAARWSVGRATATAA